MRTYTYTIYNMVYVFGVNENAFDMKITNKSTNNEYSVKLYETDPMFNDHLIVSDIDILEKLLCDCFEGKDECYDGGINFDVDGDNKNCTITLHVHGNYIRDEIVIHLQRIELPCIEMQDVVEYVRELEQRLSDLTIDFDIFKHNIEKYM